VLQVHADRQPDLDRLLLHLVNYNRNEEEFSDHRPARNKESPIWAEPVGVDLQLPAGAQVIAVRFLTPEVPGEQTIDFSQSGDRLSLRSPRFLVYGLVVIEYQ
jgi:hypothetical protein